MAVTNTLKELENAILEGEDDLAQSLAQKAIEQNIQPLNIVNEGIIPGIEEAGELWKKNEYFLPDVVMSAEAFKMAMEIIEPHLTAGEFGATGKVVIGTVAGDMHTLGGVPTSQEFADEIGADAWGKNAIDAAEKAKKLMEGS